MENIVIKQEKPEQFSLSHHQVSLYSPLLVEGSVSGQPYYDSDMRKCTSAAGGGGSEPSDAIHLPHSSNMFPSMMGLLLGHHPSDKLFSFDTAPLTDFNKSGGSLVLPPCDFTKISSIAEDLRRTAETLSPEPPPPPPINFTVIPEDDLENMTSPSQLPPTPPMDSPVDMKSSNKKVSERSQPKVRKNSSDPNKKGSKRATQQADGKPKRAKKTSVKEKKKKKEKENKCISPTTALEMGVLLVKSCLDSLHGSVDTEDDDDENTCFSSDSLSEKSTSGKCRRRGNVEVRKFYAKNKKA